MQIKKYPHKNFNNNRMLYFQVGLCVVLVLLLISVEWKSYSKPYESVTVEPAIHFNDQAFVIELPKD